jgi:hypothetical protein
VAVSGGSAGSYLQPQQQQAVEGTQAWRGPPKGQQVRLGSSQLPAELQGTRSWQLSTAASRGQARQRSLRHSHGIVWSSGHAETQPSMQGLAFAQAWVTHWTWAGSHWPQPHQ